MTPRELFQRNYRIAVAALGISAVLTAIVLLVHFFLYRPPTTPPHSRTAFYVRREKKNRVIVFIHGLYGSAASSWTCGNGSFWPGMLLKDHAFDDSDIYVASYNTSVSGNLMTLDDIVGNLDNRFANDQVLDHQDVVFVAHDLGGLVVQRLLLTRREYAPKVRFIYFFSTPQTGTQIARIASLFSQDPLLRQMFSGDGNDYLQNLEAEWKAADFSHIRRYCAYETQPTNGILVVDRLSGTRNCDEGLALPKNHVNIVKPCSAEDDAYIALRTAAVKNPAPLESSAQWLWIDPLRPPDFATPLAKVLTGVESPLTALESDELKAERKQGLPAQWIVFGSPEYDPSTIEINLNASASAKMVSYILNRNGDDWHVTGKTELESSVRCQQCAGLGGKYGSRCSSSRLIDIPMTKY